MNSEFKAGDRVRCIAASNVGCTGVVGEEYTVLATDCGCINIGTGINDRGCMASRFELVIPTPDFSTLRKGDKVTAVLTIVEDGIDADGDVAINRMGAKMWIRAKDLVSIVERAVQPIQVGDMVQWYGGNAKVIAIHSTFAWVDDPLEGPTTTDIDYLKRAD